MSKLGREAVVAVVGDGGFFGEACLAGQRTRASTATAMAHSVIVVIERIDMVQLLHTQPALCDRFIEHPLLRNVQLEADLLDQLVSPCEQRFESYHAILHRAPNSRGHAAGGVDVRRRRLREPAKQRRSSKLNWRNPGEPVNNRPFTPLLGSTSCGVSISQEAQPCSVVCDCRSVHDSIRRQPEGQFQQSPQNARIFVGFAPIRSATALTLPFSCPFVASRAERGP